MWSRNSIRMLAWHVGVVHESAVASGLVNLIPCTRTSGIHGEKHQAEREWVLNEFRNSKCNVMIATDVAARGLDVPDVRRVHTGAVAARPVGCPRVPICSCVPALRRFDGLGMARRRWSSESAHGDACEAPCVSAASSSTSTCRQTSRTTCIASAALARRAFCRVPASLRLCRQVAPKAD